jgi:hypothetical protein
VRVERQADGHDIANRRFRIVLQKKNKNCIECVPTYYVITERFLLYVFMHLLLVRNVSRHSYIGLAVPMIKYSICAANNFAPIVIWWAG